MKRKIAVVASVAAVAAGVGAGVAYADSPTAPTPAPSASPSASPGRPTAPGPGQHRARGLAARAIHGEATLAGPKHRVVDFQRGTVTAVSPTSITVKSTDGFVETFAINAGTTVRKDQKVATPAGVHPGDRVRVVGEKAGKIVTAKRIADRS